MRHANRTFFKPNPVIDSLADAFVTDYRTSLSLNGLSRKYHFSASVIKQRLTKRKVDVSSSIVSYKSRLLRTDINKDFLIWLAGFYEGEGHLRINFVKSNGKKYPSVQLGITQCDKAVLEYIRDILGTGIVSLTCKEETRGHNKNCYTLVISSTVDIYYLLLMLKPYIHIESRIRKSDEVLKLLGDKVATIRI